MALRKELLKSIWYAFTALDVEKSGKVSKSQLKVRGTQGPGEDGRHTSSALLPEPGMSTATLGAPSHPEAQAWSGGQYWVTAAHCPETRGYMQSRCPEPCPSTVGGWRWHHRVLRATGQVTCQTPCDEHTSPQSQAWAHTLFLPAASSWL